MTHYLIISVLVFSLVSALAAILSGAQADRNYRSRMLHLVGADHKQLTYLHNGRLYRLTDVAGDVIHKILV